MVWVLSLAKPEFQERLSLDINAVAHGQVWRLVTFLFIPPPSSPLWILINLYFTWWVGSSLEQNWGAFKFNAYYLLGALGTIVAAVIAGPATNFWLDASLFLAFATVFPDVQILLFFIIPVRVKWLGIIAAVGIAYAAAMGTWGTRGSIVASLANYLIFFGEHWYGVFKHRGVLARQKARRDDMRASARPGPRGGDGPEIPPRSSSVRVSARSAARAKPTASTSACAPARSAAASSGRSAWSTQGITSTSLPRN